MSRRSLNLPTCRGSYVLALSAVAARSVHAGALGERLLEAGVYLYVGSAFGPGGIKARLSRHLLGAQTLRWHVDYLRAHMLPVAAWYQPQTEPMEHLWAQVLGAGRGITVAWPGFGASDCRCNTHLFYASVMPSLAGFKARLARVGCDTGGLSAIVAAQ
ncbi:MAG: GIY-YIG nuclease family protein [Gammaproteobacteria bacterium]|nr:GIY-YIG nuclease family protein [Gammaproteobacteria bacterium]